MYPLLLILFLLNSITLNAQVVTWGNSDNGGDSSGVASELSSGVTTIHSNRVTFAALKADGSVVTWGDSGYGGDSSSVASELSSRVTTISSTNAAFAALKEDGSVVTWGNSRFGGDSSSVASKLSSGVTTIYANGWAFAALKDDGSVVAWGDSEYGGDSSSVASELSSGVTTISSTDTAFVALKEPEPESESQIFQNYDYNDQNLGTRWTITDLVSDTPNLSRFLDVTFYPQPELGPGLESFTVRVLTNYANGATFSLDVAQMAIAGYRNLDYFNGMRVSYSSQEISYNHKIQNGNESSGSWTYTIFDNLSGGSNLGALGTPFFNEDLVNETITYQGILEIDINETPDINNSSSNIVFNPVSVSFSSGDVTIEWDTYNRTITNVLSIPNPEPKPESESRIFQNYDYNDQNLGTRWTITDLVSGGSNLGALGTPFFNEDLVNETITYQGILEIDINETPDINNSSSNIVFNPVSVSFSSGDVTIEWDTYNRTITNVLSIPNPEPEPALVVTWGSSKYGGDSTSVASELSSGVTTIYSTVVSFAALKADGSVVTWGDSRWGGDSSSVASELSSGVRTIFSTNRAFAALKDDGSVVTWGWSDYGGDSSSVASELSSGVTTIFSTDIAFAALKDDGSVVTWGSSTGGDSSSVASELYSGVTNIYSTSVAFAALKDDGSVVTWGNPIFVESGRPGIISDGYVVVEPSSVASELSSGVTTIYANESAFAALKDDGSVVTWGRSDYGGDPGSVASELSSGVITIYSTGSAFAALIGDSDEDGVLDNIDAFPNDPTESVDTDSDNIGDNADEFPTISTQDVVNAIESNPNRYNLYSPDDIKDLRAGSTMIAVENGEATLSIELEQSDDLEIWTNESTTTLQIPIQAMEGERFFRFKMNGSNSSNDSDSSSDDSSNDGGFYLNDEEGQQTVEIGDGPTVRPRP